MQAMKPSNGMNSHRKGSSGHKAKKVQIKEKLSGNYIANSSKSHAILEQVIQQIKEQRQA